MICLEKVAALGTFFLIKKEIDNKWNISKEQKIIDNYICYKATKTSFKESFKGNQVEVKVEAWYCPELNVSFGPLGYHGLPGLILELHLDNVIYYASSIKFFKNKLENIERPKAKNKISQNDFDKLLKEAYENRKN